GMTTTEPTSKRRCAWRLPDSFDLVSLHGINPPASISHTTMSFSTQTTSNSHSHHPKLIRSITVSPSSSPAPHPPQCAQSVPSKCSSLDFPKIPPTLYSLAHSVPSTDNISSTKSRKCSSEQESLPSASPVI